jgi:formylglycine-generating enzyme required for sulfatase activity/uncharacterized SAM-dependent methyltransferase
MKKIDKPIPIENFYDREGTQIYEEIIQEPDYYLYQTEKQLLEKHAATLVENMAPNSIILEIGCGSAEKIYPLIKESVAAPHHNYFVANDISEKFLELTRDFYQSKNLEIDTLPCHIFEEAHLVRERYPHQTIVMCWLGSSFLNFPLSKGQETLRYLLETIRPEMVLLGYDCWKNGKEEQLTQAYDNKVTERFIRNGYEKYLTAKKKKLSSTAEYHVEVDPTLQRVEMGFLDNKQFRIVELSYKISQDSLQQMMKQLEIYPIKLLEDTTYHYNVSLFRTRYGLQPKQFWSISQKYPDSYTFHDVSYAIQKVRYGDLRLTKDFQLTSYATPLQRRQVINQIICYWNTLPGTFLGPLSLLLKANKQNKTNKETISSSLLGQTSLIRGGTTALTTILHTLDFCLRRGFYKTDKNAKTGKNTKKSKTPHLVVRMIPDYRVCTSSLSVTEFEYLDIPYHWDLTHVQKTLSQHQDQIVAILTVHPSAPLGRFHPQLLSTIASWAHNKKWIWIIDEILLPTLSRTPPDDLFEYSLQDIPICLVGGLGKVGLEEFSPTFVSLFGVQWMPSFARYLSNHLHKHSLTSHELTRLAQLISHDNWNALQYKRKQTLLKKRQQFQFIFDYFKIEYEIHDSICAWIDVSKWISTWELHREFYHFLFTQYHILMTPGEVLGRQQPGVFRIRYTAPYHVLRYIAKSMFSLLSYLNSNFVINYYQQHFIEASQQTNFIFSLLKQKHLGDRPVSERRPFIFYQGHIPAFLWIIMRRAFQLPAIQDTYENLFERGIDPSLRTGEVHTNSVDTVAEQQGGQVDYPVSTAIQAYDTQVRQQVEQWIYNEFKNGLDTITVRPLLLALEHEYMHQETLMYMIQKTPLEWFDVPQEEAQKLVKKVITPAKQIAIQWMRVPSNQVYLGRFREHDNPHDYAWDNEYGPQYLDMPDCWMTRYPITNHQFLEFVEDEGYQTADYWETEHWDFIQQKKIVSPENWNRHDDTWLVRFPCREVPLTQCVNYSVIVSLAEAKAYSQWYNATKKANTRIPTEQEWLQAVEMDSPQLPPLYHRLYQSDIGNLSRLEPLPLQENADLENKYGISHLVGNGWELTSSVFQPLGNSPTKFQPDVYYPDYSRDFFDGEHYVLKGASWATPIRMVRPSFRNFYQDLYRYAFTQFRLVCSKKPT